MHGMLSIGSASPLASGVNPGVRASLSDSGAHERIHDLPHGSGGVRATSAALLRVHSGARQPVQPDPWSHDGAGDLPALGVQVILPYRPTCLLESLRAKQRRSMKGDGSSCPSIGGLR